MYDVIHMGPPLLVPGDGGKVVGSFDTLDDAYEFVWQKMGEIGGQWKLRDNSGGVTWIWGFSGGIGSNYFWVTKRSECLP